MADARQPRFARALRIRTPPPLAMWRFSSVQFAIEFEAVKSRRNEQERGLPFQRVAGFDFGSALFGVDDRKDYGEPRVVALGLMDGRVHAICFTFIGGGIRVISLRKANKREVYRHDQSTAAHRR